MGLFNWLKGLPRTKAPTLQTSLIESKPIFNQPSEKEIFQSPALLADWVYKFMLMPRPLEVDYELLPDDETRKDLNITFEQRERCVREYSILRMAGVSLFIKQYYSDSFWLTFSGHIAKHIRRHIYGEGLEVGVGQIGEVIDRYVSLMLEDVEKCRQFYLSRIYDDNDNYLELKFAGIGFISCDMITSIYEVFRDTYCQVTQGMSYENLKLFTDAIEKNSGDRD